MGRPRKNPVAASVAPKKIHSLEGLSDVITETDIVWETLLKRLQKISRMYGFARVELPFLEDAHLYQNFYANQPNVTENLLILDAGGKQVALRPSLLPAVLRSYAQHKIYDKAPLSKWSYSGMVVKYDKEREKLASHYEYGFEVFGTFNHLTEAQVLGAVWEFLRSLGLEDVVLEINNIGKAECQTAYEETLQDFLTPKKYQLCDNCNEALNGRVLNVFRCENIDCQTLVAESPTILDFLDPESHKHFTSILEALDELGIPYQLNQLLAGPEGYSRTNAVIKYKYKGQTLILGEGGYHDGLVQSITGKQYCCFGFHGNLSALHYLLSSENVVVDKEIKNDVFLVPLGELASKKSLRLFRDLTLAQISVYDHFGTAGVKNQLKQAEVYKAPIALIIGQKEAIDEMVILRDVKSGMQEIISYDKIVDEVKKRLGR